MTTEEIYRTLIKIVKPHNGYTAQLEAIARWVESDFEPKNQGQILPMHGVVKSSYCEDGHHEVMKDNGYCGICNKKIGCVV
jgi:hypothetical protein